HACRSTTMTQRTESPATVSTPDATALEQVQAQVPEAGAGQGRTEQPAPEPGKREAEEQAKDPALAQAAAGIEAAKRAAEERDAALQAQVVADLKALTRAYSRGERAYRDGLLEAGRLAQAVVLGKLGLGHKRASAVQAIEGALAPYSSDRVDVSRLV